MQMKIKRLLMPIFLCLSVACLIEIPLGQTELFGEDIILWDTMFRTILVMPGLMYFYREDCIFRKKKRWNWKRCTALIFLGIVLSTTARLILSYFNEMSYEMAEQNLLTGNLWLQTVVLLICSPLLEEFFFRGVLYERMKEIWSERTALLVSSLFFALYHGNLPQGIYGFFMGAVLCMAMDWCHTVKAPIVLHAAANFAALCLNFVSKL